MLTEIKNSLIRFGKFLASIDERLLRKERAAVAKAFNNLYCYRFKYPYNKGVAHHWMCPDCNSIHKSCNFSPIDGLHYPACCGTPYGNRLFNDIKY